MSIFFNLFSMYALIEACMKTILQIHHIYVDKGNTPETGQVTRLETGWALRWRDQGER